MKSSCGNPGINRVREAKGIESIQTEFFCIRGQHECEKDARFDYILRSDAEAREAVIIVA